MKLDRIIIGDCIEGMKRLRDNSFELIIADPPYNLGKDFGPWKENERSASWLPWCKQWLNECNRLLAVGGSIFVYGIHRHLCWLQCHLYDLGLKYQRQIIWHYENGFSGYTKTLAAQYEPLLWFSKGATFTYNPIREPYKSTERLKYKVVKNGRVWQPHPEGRMAGDVWRFPVLAGKRFAEERVDHPTQKPLDLSLRIVKHFSNQGDRVLVPFVGSGTECVACHCVGRKFVGFEINEDYVDIALARLKQASAMVKGVRASLAST